jgi:hypothetical protein
MSWSILYSELWCETVCPNKTTSKKVTISKIVIFAKILILSRSSCREWAIRWISTSSVKKYRPGRIKLNFEFFSMQYFIISFIADVKRKLGIFVMATPFLVEVGIWPSWVYNFMSWSILYSELWCETVCPNETTSIKVTILKVVDFACFGLVAMWIGCQCSFNFLFEGIKLRDGQTHITVFSHISCLLGLISRRLISTARKMLNRLGNLELLTLSSRWCI